MSNVIIAVLKYYQSNIQLRNGHECHHFFEKPKFTENCGFIEKIEKENKFSKNQF